MQSSRKTREETRSVIRFGEVAQEARGTSKDPLSEGLERYVGLEHIDTESLHLSRWGMIADDNPTFTKKFKAGQILFGRRRAYLKKAAIPEFDGVCSGDITVIEPKGKALISQLLPFIVQSDKFFSWAIKHSAGGLSPRTKFKSLAEFKFPLPSEIQQRRMLGLLKKNERTVSSLLASKESLLNLLLMFLLDVFPNYFEKNLNNHKPLPIGWQKYRLRELLNSEPESGYSANEISDSSDFHVLNLNCLTRTGFEHNDYKPIEEKDFLLSKELREGDFLISRSNTKALVGLVGIYTSPEQQTIFPDTMMRLSINKEIVLPEFLEMYLLSPFGRRQVTRLAAGTHSSMLKINKSNLNTVPVAVPNLDTQKSMVKLYRLFQEHKEMFSSQIKESRRLGQLLVEEYMWNINDI